MAEKGSSNPQSPEAHVDWQSVIDRVSPAIVALQVTAARSFQDNHAGAHGGTGFVVDAARGLLLTNRHVCTCGPARHTATFVGSPSMEEVPVSIAYIDPVHDFAMLRFDPEALQQTPRAEIALDPAGLRVGEEIRVLGNDSLEKLQILSGTVARIDRNPPEVAGDYNDENTFYALASSGTRGGSSGSPVLNRAGQAVALNAAAKEGTMHAFYLPLHRISRALRAVQAGEAVSRGTLCAAFQYTSFPEVVRLGVDKKFLQHSVLDMPASPGGTFSLSTPPGGMLQVRSCIPGTPAAEALQPGDVLLELNGAPCVDFVLWDTVLDASVGEAVRLSVCRQGRRVDVELVVEDLHASVPHSFLELAFGIFHDVPYQSAMRHHIPLRGVYVAQAGFVFGETVRSDAVITEVNGTPCHDLRAFEEALRQIPHKEYFVVRWTLPKSEGERGHVESATKMLSHWGKSRFWSRAGAAHPWVPRDFCSGGSPPAEADEAPSTRGSEEAAEPTTPLARGEHAEATPKKKARRSVGGARAALAMRMCDVRFRTDQTLDMGIALTADNVEIDNFVCRGTGIVLDPDLGLVLTDRTTVPQSLGDIEVTLGDAVRGASVLFTHPLHSLVVLRVDPEPGAPADGPRHFGQAVVFAGDLEPGDDCEFVGFDERGRAVSSAVQVADVRPGKFPTYTPPRWHESNLEAVILVENAMTPYTGVLCDTRGRVHAFYSVAIAICEEDQQRLGYGIPVESMRAMLEHFRGPLALTAPFRVPSLECRFEAAELSKVRRLPPRLRPSAAWLSRLSADGCRVLQVSRVMAGGPCDGIAEEGDLLVAVNGELVTSNRTVEARLRQAAADAEASKGKEGAEVRLTLLRRGRERTVAAPLRLLGSDGTERVLCWHGLVLREVPRAVREAGPDTAGVHIAQTLLGSPSEAANVEGEFLVAVEGAPTHSLDEVFVAAKAAAAAPPAKGQRRHLRLETADSSGRRFVRPVEPDPLFWPLLELVRDASGAWSCKERAGA